MTPERLKHGQDFLDAVHKAMENIDDVVATVNEYSDTHDYPPLAASYTSRRDAIDEEKLEKLESLVHFLTRALFGRDCDNDPVVCFSLVHLGTHENFLPFWKVPKVDDFDDSLEDRLRNYRLAKRILETVQTTVDRKKRFIDEDVERVIKTQSMLKAAEQCDTCRGKGWIKSTKKTYEKHSYGVYCENWGIGAYRNGPYRVPCKCQKEREICGWSK